MTTMYKVRVNASGYLSRDPESGYLCVSWYGELFPTEASANRALREYLSFAPGQKCFVERREFNVR